MKQNETNTGLTESEEKLLEIMLSPENRMKSITDICTIAKIGRATYYRAFEKPEFCEVYNSKSKDLVKQSVAPVINTFIREAQRGSFQHGKVILEMAGIYTEKQQMEHTGKDGGPIEVQNMTDEEIEKRLAELGYSKG